MRTRSTRIYGTLGLGAAGTLLAALACGSGTDGDPSRSELPVRPGDGSPRAGDPEGSSDPDGADATPAPDGNGATSGDAPSDATGNSEARPDPAGGVDPGASGEAGGGPATETGDDAPGNEDGDDESPEGPEAEPDEPEPPEETAPPDPRPFFSFFVTSQAGLYGLPAGDIAPAPDPANGYGGNFGGLAGADEICTMLAQQSNPGDTKDWRAFLSASGFDGGERVDAIDRIGEGPWFDYNGRLLAEDLQGLLPQGNDGRPRGAEPQLAAMFTDENGDDAQPNPQIDNHDTLTGSGEDGRLFDDGEGGRVATCEDWTSNTLRGQQGNFAGQGAQVPVGHSWPRNDNNGRHWISEHTINGCEPGFDIDGGAGAPPGDFRVGAGGGYGGIYCFALGAVPPEP